MSDAIKNKYIRYKNVRKKKICHVLSNESINHKP